MDDIDIEQAYAARRCLLADERTSVLNYVRGEPNDITPGTIGMLPSQDCKNAG
jgi:hypothetical protein